MNSKIQIRNLSLAALTLSIVMASCGTAPMQQKKVDVQSHTFSNGEKFTYTTSLDGDILTDDDVMVTTAQNLPALITKYETYLQENAGKIDQQGVGITKYCSFEFIGCWSYTDNRWPSGKAYYGYAADITASEHTSILAAINDWNSRVTDIKWVYSPSASDRVQFTHASDPNVCGSSPIGKQGGVQNLRLNCFGKGVVQHEMGHAVGLLHEQSRCDRDNFVTIVWANIMSDYTGNFNKACGKEYKDYGSYNYNSVMHYSAKAFSSNGGFTIVPKNGVSTSTIGQRVALDAGDVSALNAMY